MLIWGNLCWVCIITFIVTPRLIRLDRGGSEERSQHMFSLRSDALNDLKLRIQWYVYIFVSTDEKKISCSINFSTNSTVRPIVLINPLMPIAPCLSSLISVLTILRFSFMFYCADQVWMLCPAASDLALHNWTHSLITRLCCLKRLMIEGDGQEWVSSNLTYRSEKIIYPRRFSHRTERFSLLLLCVTLYFSHFSFSVFLSVIFVQWKFQQQHPDLV